MFKVLKTFLCNEKYSTFIDKLKDDYCLICFLKLSAS